MVSDSILCNSQLEGEIVDKMTMSHTFKVHETTDVSKLYQRTIEDEAPIHEYMDSTN